MKTSKTRTGIALLAATLAVAVAPAASHAKGNYNAAPAAPAPTKQVDQTSSLAVFPAESTGDAKKDLELERICGAYQNALRGYDAIIQNPQSSGYDTMNALEQSDRVEDQALNAGCIVAW